MEGVFEFVLGELGSSSLIDVLGVLFIWIWVIFLNMDLGDEIVFGVEGSYFEYKVYCL